MPTNYTQIFYVRPEKLKAYRGALSEAKKQSLAIALGELDDYGRQVVKDLQTAAPSKKGLFAQGFTYKLVKSGPDLGSLYVNWYPKDRPKNLLDWITFGTGLEGPRHHRIVPKAVWANEKRVKKGKKPKAIPEKKKWLSWQDPDTGEWIHRRSTRGMKRNPFVFKVWLSKENQNRLAALYQNVGKLIAERVLEKTTRT